MSTAWYSATCKDCAVQISIQHTANYLTGLLPVPLLPSPRGYPPRKRSIPQGQSEGCRVQGMSVCRAAIRRMETACRAKATSKANASPAAVTGACRDNRAFLTLQPATVIPPAVCPSPSVILPRESASASGSPRGDAVKNASYVLSFCYYFCMWF